MSQPSQSKLDDLLLDISRSLQIVSDKKSSKFQKRKSFDLVFEKSKSAYNYLNCDEFHSFASHCISFLINGLVDSAECNREKALQILDFFISTSPSFVLKRYSDICNMTLCITELETDKTENANEYTFPLKPISEIISSLKQILYIECIEPSEEIRLLMISLLLKILCLSKIPHFQFLDDYCYILIQTLQDSYHEVKKVSSSACIALTLSTRGYFHSYSSEFIKPLIFNISHQHSRVRATTVKTLFFILQYGDNKQIDNICSHLAQRLFDNSPLVREQIIFTIGNWLLDLPDRYSFHNKLIPLILTETFDEIPNLSNQAFLLWYDIGLKYEKENEDDIKDMQDFPRISPKHYPLGVERPNLGCRVLMFRNLSKIILPLSKDLVDWVVATRIKSAQLLGVLIINAEECITQHMETVLSSCYKAALDEEELVRSGVDQALFYAGHFVETKMWWALLSPVLKRADNQLRSALFCLVPLIRGSNPIDIQCFLGEIVDVLVLDDVCFNYSLHVKLLQLKCVQAILGKVSDNSGDIHGNLYYILAAIGSLQANQQDSEVTHAIEDGVKSELHQLCSALNLPSILMLHRKFFTFVTDKFKFYDDWTKHSPHRVLFEGLCLEVGPVVGQSLPSVMPIFKACLNPNKDVELRLKLFLLLAKLVSNASETVNSTGEFLDYVPSIIEDMILPNCQWRAGRTSEAIRKVAVTCFWTLLQGIGDDLSVLLQVKAEFLPFFALVLDDDSPETRLLACKCLLSVLKACGNEIEKDSLHKFYPNLLKRMDDTQDAVRSQICLVFRLWFQVLREDFDRSLYGAHYEEIFRSLLIHLDDQEPNIQSDVFEVLAAAGPLHPVKLKEEIDRVRHKHRSDKLLCDLEDIIMPGLLDLQAST